MAGTTETIEVALKKILKRALELADKQICSEIPGLMNGRVTKAIDEFVTVQLPDQLKTTSEKIVGEFKEKISDDIKEKLNMSGGSRRILPKTSRKPRTRKRKMPRKSLKKM
jgi:hypothetical protein